MSIKSDKWIRRKSVPPTHLLYVRPGSSEVKEPAWEGITHTREQLENLEARFYAVRLKDDDPIRTGFKPMIEPFEYGQVRSKFVKNEVLNNRTDKLISYGTSSYGYDVRCADEFKVFTNINSATVDPKNFDEKAFVDIKSDVCIIPPNSFALARTVEYFRIPRNVLTICLGKSTYARCGIIVNVTPLEPEWEGHVVLEFSNTTSLPAKLYANEGVAQFLFLESDEACETSYRDRGGKYMGQQGITLPKM